MIKIVILYIFALYILLIPGVLIKKNYSLPEKILYSVLFAVILYFTYDLVDQKREFMNVNINSTGVDNIKKISDSMKSTTDLSVDYDNTVQETEITENVGDALIKTYGEMSPLYQEEVDINKDLNKYEKEQKELQYLRAKLLTLEQEINTMNQELLSYNTVSNDLFELKKNIDSKETSISKLESSIEACNKKNKELDEKLSEDEEVFIEKEKLLTEEETKYEKALENSKKINTKKKQLLDRFTYLDNQACCEGSHFIRDGWFNKDGNLKNSNTESATNDNSFKTPLFLCPGDELLVDGCKAVANYDYQVASRGPDGTGATDTYATLFREGGTHKFSEFESGYKKVSFNDDGCLGQDVSGNRFAGPYFKYKHNNSLPCKNYLITHGGFSKNTTMPRAYVTVNGKPYDGCKNK